MAINFREAGTRLDGKIRAAVENFIVPTVTDMTPNGPVRRSPDARNAMRHNGDDSWARRIS